jgi:NADH:ubiquinone oxidoreductase subunit 3 (subunit A)
MVSKNEIAHVVLSVAVYVEVSFILCVLKLITSHFLSTTSKHSNYECDIEKLSAGISKIQNVTIQRR